MPKNQLFRVKPDEAIINKLLMAFGLMSLNDTNNFTRRDLETIGTIQALENMREELENYYLPCKKKYLQELTTKKAITVLRQFVKVIGFKINSKEKYSQGVKYIIYSITEGQNEVMNNITVSTPTSVVSFN